MEKYTLIFIENIEDNEHSKKIYSKYDLDDDEKSDYLNIDTDETDVRFYDYAGEEVSIKNIKAKDVLTAAVSADGSVIRIHVGSNRLTGTVNEFDIERHSICINNESFDLSYLMPEDIIGLLEIGGRYTFFLTVDKRVAAIDKAFDMADGDFGYLVKFIRLNGLGDTYKFKIFTGVGEMKYYKASNNFKVNDTKPENTEHLQTLLKAYTATGTERRDNAGELAYDQLVKFTLNKDNEIASIITAKRGSNIIEGSFSHNMDVGLNSKVYYSSSTSHFNYTYKISDNALIFNVPSDISRDEEYSIGNTFVNDSNYKGLEYYDMDSFYNIGVLVYRSDFSALTGDIRLTGKREASGGTYAIMVVDSVSKGIKEDGSSCYIIKGLQRKARVSYVLSDDFTKIQDAAGNDVGQNVPFKRGDIVRLATSSNKVTQSLTEFTPNNGGRIFIGATTTSNVGQRYSDNSTRETVYGFGQVYRIKGDYMLVDYNTGYQPIKFDNSAKLYLYNIGSGKVNVITAKDISVNDKMYYQIFRGTLEAAVVYRGL